MKKKAIKIAASTAVAASAFVAAAPAQQADAASNANQLATNAQNAGTVLKWAISYEGSADFKTRPYTEFNAAKKAVAAAEAAASKLSTTEKLSLQAKLVDAKVQIVRATAYIDAITSSEKIIALTSDLNAAIKTGDLGKVETAYHAASFEYKKQAKLLDRVYGQSTRDGIRNAVKPAMEAALESVKYDVTVKMHLDKASALIKDSKFEEAAAELAKADYNLTLKDAKFTFKSTLEKSYADVATSLPLQALSAVGDGKNTVTVKFSKAYTLDKDLTTLEAGQFKISGLTVQSAKLSDDKKSVILTTSNQAAAKEYTLVWQGKSVTFTTPAVADNSGISINEKDETFLETTESRTYTAKLTNTDGSAYVGRVRVELNAGVITTVNGQPQTSPSKTWEGVTDGQGNLVYTIAAANNATIDTASVIDIEPKLSKLDGDKKSKTASVTHFLQLQKLNTTKTLSVTDFHVSAANDFVYAEGLKYKWDNNDQFFVRGQKVTQDAFETALSDGDTLTVDYKTASGGVSTWNITVDVTKAAISFTNPTIKTGETQVRFDGYNYDLSGKAQAGNTIKIYRDGVFLNTTTVDSSGNWTVRAVNLTQDAKNVFTAYQYTPGTDGVNGTGAVNSKSVTISEGAFASTAISLQDRADNGLSIQDTLTFSFLNNDKSFEHKFLEDSSGTITVNDGFGRKATLKVEEAGTNVLKVVDITNVDRNFKFDSASITILSTTGVENQDKLQYNVTASTSTTLNGVVVTPPASASERAALVSAIGEANTLANGANAADYVAGAVDTYKAAIASAAVVVAADASTKAQVDAAKTSLDAATKAFNEAKKPAEGVLPTATTTVQAGALLGTKVVTVKLDTDKDADYTVTVDGTVLTYVATADEFRGVVETLKTDAEIKAATVVTKK